MISLLNPYPYVGQLIIVSNMKSWRDVHVVTKLDYITNTLYFKKIGHFHDELRTSYKGYLHDSESSRDFKYFEPLPVQYLNLVSNA